MGVLLADGDPHARSALRLLLDHEPTVQVVGEAGTASNLLTQVRLMVPRLVLLDWDLPGLDPVAFLGELRACCPGVSVIALSSRPEAASVSLGVGVDGFVCKGDPPDGLQALVRRSASTLPAL